MENKIINNGSTEPNGLSVKANILWNSIGSFIYLFSQWLLTVIIVNVVGYGDNGYFTLAMSLSNTFGVIANYGMRNYQVSDVEDKYSNGTYILSRYITSIFAFFSITLFAVFSGYSAKVISILLAYMVFKLSETFVDVYQGICQKKWHMDIIGKSLLIRSFTTFAGFTITLIFTQNLLLSILVMAVMSYIVIFLYDVRKSDYLADNKTDVSIKSVKNLLKECLPLVIYLFLSNGVIAFPRYVLEKISGEEILGIYGSISAPTVIVQVAASYLFMPFISVFAQYYADRDFKHFFSLLKKILLGISAVSVVAIVGCRLFGRWGLSVLFSDSILPFAYLLIPIMIVTILNAIVWFLCALLTVIRDFKGLIISNVIMFGICVISSYFLIPKMSVDGVNISLYITLGSAIILLTLFGLLKFSKKEN